MTKDFVMSIIARDIHHFRVGGKIFIFAWILGEPVLWREDDVI